MNRADVILTCEECKSVPCLCCVMEHDSGWVFLGVNPLDKTVFSRRFEAVREFPEEEEYIVECYAEAIEMVEKCSTDNILVMSGMGGNNWCVAFYEVDTLERAWPWIISPNNYPNSLDALTTYNARVVGAPLEPVAIPEDDDERDLVALNVFRGEREILGEGWAAAFVTKAEVLEALKNGGNVPSYATAEAGEAWVSGEAAKLRAACDDAGLTPLEDLKTDGSVN